LTRVMSAVYRLAWCMLRWSELELVLRLKLVHQMCNQ